MDYIWWTVIYCNNPATLLLVAIICDSLSKGSIFIFMYFYFKLCNNPATVLLVAIICDSLPKGSISYLCIFTLNYVINKGLEHPRV